VKTAHGVEQTICVLCWQCHASGLTACCTACVLLGVVLCVTAVQLLGLHSEPGVVAEALCSLVAGVRSMIITLCSNQVKAQFHTMACWCWLRGRYRVCVRVCVCACACVCVCVRACVSAAGLCGHFLVGFCILGGGLLLLLLSALLHCPCLHAVRAALLLLQLDSTACRRRWAVHVWRHGDTCEPAEIAMPAVLCQHVVPAHPTGRAPRQGRLLVAAPPLLLFQFHGCICHSAGMHRTRCRLLPLTSHTATSASSDHAHVTRGSCWPSHIMQAPRDVAWTHHITTALVAFGLCAVCYMGGSLLVQATSRYVNALSRKAALTVERAGAYMTPLVWT
jgi:hypothetical protein